MSVDVVSVIGVVVAVILTADRIPHALAGLLRSCVEVVRAARELRAAFTNELTTGQNSGTASADDPSNGG
jgi:Sec-independent protein translocase protein TatA